MTRYRGPPSQTWRTFLRATFERLFALIIIGHGRRQLLWFAVTRHPTAEWLAQQIVEAFPWDTAPAYLVRDNDRSYGQVFLTGSDRWEFGTARRHRDRLGRTHMSNGSSGRSAGKAWIMC